MSRNRYYVSYEVLDVGVPIFGTEAVETSFELDDPVTDDTLIQCCREDAKRYSEENDSNFEYVEGSYSPRGVSSL